MALALPAIPALSAIQPACRPMTSTTITSPVRLGGGMQPVDALGSERYGGIESKRQCRRFQIVIDGFRHADNGQALLMQLMADLDRSVAADHHQPIDARCANPSITSSERSIVVRLPSAATAF